MIQSGKAPRDGSVIAYSLRGNAYAKKGDHDGIIADYNKAGPFKESGQ